MIVRKELCGGTGQQETDGMAVYAFAQLREEMYRLNCCETVDERIVKAFELSVHICTYHRVVFIFWSLWKIKKIFYACSLVHIMASVFKLYLNFFHDDNIVHLSRKCKFSSHILCDICKICGSASGFCAVFLVPVQL